MASPDHPVSRGHSSAIAPLGRTPVPGARLRPASLGGSRACGFEALHPKTRTGRGQPHWAAYPRGCYLPSTVAPIGLVDGIMHLEALIEEGYYRFTPPPEY